MKHIPVLVLALALGMVIDLVASANPPIHLSSPDGRLILSIGVSNLDESVDCPVYTLSNSNQVLLAPSRFGLRLSNGLLREHMTVLGQTNTFHDSTWRPVYGERGLIRDHYNELVVDLQETVALKRRLQLTFRAYNEGIAFCYTLPPQPGLSQVTNLTEQTEFRFTGDHHAWATAGAQGNYTASTIGTIPSGCERPLTVQVSTNLYLALGEARLVDYARMKFKRNPDTPNSLVSVLSGPVTSPLPLTTPWRFIMVADSPGQLLENNHLVLNLNDPCELGDTSWIKPGKVIREVSLTTTGGMACVDFVARHHLHYVEFDAGWYGPEYTTTDATRVNLDPARQRGPLDLQAVIAYARSKGVGIILYVNQVALTRQIDILPALYRSWGVKGMKFGFVNVGSQSATAWLHSAIRKCATNQIMVDVHDEARPTGYSRTYPNLMTLEGIRGDEEAPPASQELATLFTRMLAGAGDHTVCYFESRVTNKWSHAYQLAKAVCFYSPWQFLYWYDRPTNSSGYVSGGNAMISEVPELEFYDRLPVVWDDTRVLDGAIGQYAIIARRSGTDWFLGAMNAGTNRAFKVILDFLTPGQNYVLHTYLHDAELTTRTHVRIDRSTADSKSTWSFSLPASSGQAAWLTPATN